MIYIILLFSIIFIVNNAYEIPKMNIKKFSSVATIIASFGLQNSPSFAIDPATLRQFKGGDKISLQSPNSAPSTGKTITMKDIEQMKQIQDSMDAEDIEYIKLKSGATYREFREGKGNKVIKPGDIVTVELTARAKSFATQKEPGGVLIYSTKDDTPYNAMEIAITGTDFMPGVQEALIGMKRGAIRRIEIPSVQTFQARDENTMFKPTTDDHKRRLKSLFKTEATLIVEVLVDKITESALP